VLVCLLTLQAVKLAFMLGVCDMDLYRKMHKEFFFATAHLRHQYGLSTVCLEDIAKWLSEDEIKDFTVAYMMGGEL